MQKFKDIHIDNIDIIKKFNQVLEFLSSAAELKVLRQFPEFLSKMFCRKVRPEKLGNFLPEIV